MHPPYKFAAANLEAKKKELQGLRMRREKTNNEEQRAKLSNQIGKLQPIVSQMQLLVNNHTENTKLLEWCKKTRPYFEALQKNGSIGYAIYVKVNGKDHCIFKSSDDLEKSSESKASQNIRQ